MYSIIGAALAQLTRFLETLGLSPGPIYRSLDLPPPGTIPERIPLDSYLRVKGIAAKRLADPDLGLRFARMAEWRAYGLMGHLFTHTQTLGEALQKRQQHSRLWKQGDRLEVQRSGDQLQVTYHLPPVGSLLGRRVDLTESLAMLVLTAQQLTGAEIPLKEVAFAHPPPASPQAYRGLFGDAPLRFEAEAYRLSIDPKVLALPIRGADPQLGRYLELAARAAAPNPTPQASGLSQQVAHIVGLGLPTLPTLDQVHNGLYSERNG